MSNGALFGILAAAAAGVAIAVLVNKNKKTNTKSAEVVEIDLNKLNQYQNANEWESRSIYDDFDEWMRLKNQYNAAHNIIA